MIRCTQTIFNYLPNNVKEIEHEILSKGSIKVWFIFENGKKKLLNKKKSVKLDRL